MNDRVSRRICLLVGVLVFIGMPGPLWADHEVPELTEAATDAVKGEFPYATIVGVGREREAGVTFYEVVLRDGDRRVEVEVAADGAIGEIETAVTLADVPRAALDAIARETGGVRVHEVERSEVRGRPSGDTFEPVDPPIIVYEVEYTYEGRRHELAVTADGQVFEEAEDDDHDDDEDDDHVHHRHGDHD